MTHLAMSKAHLCAGCMQDRVHDAVDGAIEQWKMVRPGDHVLACVSGEKDSTVMLHLLHRWVVSSGTDAKITVLAVDEGLGTYRTRCVEVVGRHAETLGLDFVADRFVDRFGTDLGTLEQQRQPDGRRMCQYCCSLRAHTVRDVATELGVNVVATGSNLDDGAEYAITAMLRGVLDVHGMPAYTPPGTNVRFVAPLSAVEAIEVGLYARLAGIEVLSEDCMHCAEHLRDDIRDSLTLLEDRQPGAREALYAGYRRMIEHGAAGSPVEPRAVALSSPSLRSGM